MVSMIIASSEEEKHEAGTDELCHALLEDPINQMP